MTYRFWTQTTANLASNVIFRISRHVVLFHFFPVLVRHGEFRGNARYCANFVVSHATCLTLLYLGKQSHRRSVRVLQTFQCYLHSVITLILMFASHRLVVEGSTRLRRCTIGLKILAQSRRTGESSSGLHQICYDAVTRETIF